MQARGEAFNPQDSDTGAPTGVRGRRAQSKEFNFAQAAA